MSARSTRTWRGLAVALSTLVLGGAVTLAGQAWAHEGAHKGTKGPHGKGVRGSVECSGVAPTAVAHDLIVPAGKTCTILAGTSVRHDVVVRRGATLTDEGGQIGHDIRADDPAGIGIGGGTGAGGQPILGSVRHDVSLAGVSGAGPGRLGANYVCGTQIGHDLVVKRSSASAGEWVIGDTDAGLCSQGNKVRHDLRVRGNANRVDVSDNNVPARWAIGHDLTVQGNALAPVVESNTVRHAASCQANRTQDGDGTPNVAGRRNSCG
jgi:hypothetical protein